MMHRNNSSGSGAATARGFMAFFAIMLAMGPGLMAGPAEAQPFAYVTNRDTNGPWTVSVIDTATNMVVATVPLLQAVPAGVAVTPDGKHVYVVDQLAFEVIDTATNMEVGLFILPVNITKNPQPEAVGVVITPDGKYAYVTDSQVVSISGLVSVAAYVIDTATNVVVATFPGVSTEMPGLVGVAITPDGKHAYVTNPGANTVLLIDTATNTLVGTPIPVGANPNWIAVNSNGKHAYVTNQNSNNVSVIDTATNMVVGTPIPVGSGPYGVAVTPDGKHAYVANNGSNNVSVIDTATNMVVGTPIPVGSGPLGVAFTPDGKHAYVANSNSNNVSVIDTATNMAVGTPIPVGNGPFGVAIVPPPTCIPFLAFSAKLEIDQEHKPNKDRFELLSSFTLGSASNGIDPATEPVTLRVGTFTTTIPPASFKEVGLGIFVFRGAIGGVRLEALIAPTGAKRYALVTAAQDANLTGTTNPVAVTLTIGDDCGTASVQALIIP